jgi:MFS family permease
MTDDTVPQAHGTRDIADPSPSVAVDEIYGVSFWLAYAANLALVAANSMTFRFAEFVAWLSGPGTQPTETLTGAIIRVGLITSVIVRIWLGDWMDRHGERRIWLVSSLLFIASALSFLACARAPQMIWLARIGYAVGLAGMFSCSVVHIQNQVPAHRRTEVIGSLGSSGFVGTILGTQLGDLIFLLLTPQVWAAHWRFVALFGGVAVLGAIHMLVVIRLTRGDRHVPPQHLPPAWKLLWRHWPGPILLVAVAMGSGFVVTTVFLTRYATALGLRGIGTFFLCYSITAFSCRWLFRNWGRTAGRHGMVLWGLAGMTIGHWLFLTMISVDGSLASLVGPQAFGRGFLELVTTDRMFVLPAVASGFGHALLYPAVVSLGAGRFPAGNRGSGTTLVLGFIELGTATAAPVMGWLIDAGNARQPVLGFAWMFIAAGAISLITGLFYLATSARHADVDPTFPEITVLDGIGDECVDTGESARASEASAPVTAPSGCWSPRP